MIRNLTVLLISIATEAKILNLSDDKCVNSLHRVDSLPYFNPESGEFPCMATGTVKSNEVGTHNTFYWLFRNENEDAPLTIWLNGGPGSSSMFSNFLMNGPIRFKKTGDGPDDFSADV